MEYWPASLPVRPLQDGASVSLPDNRRVTKMDAGPAKIRLKATTAPEPHRYSYAMTAAQLATFKAFYETILHYGTDTFYWPDWRLFNNDAAPVYVQARFSPEANPPSYRPDDHEFIVTIDLEVWA
ncbi:MAG TPA: hypothetical protein PKJ52_06740 [Rectinema sp.]|nr:hypothetical protein [Rectinema sp.]